MNVDQFLALPAWCNAPMAALSIVAALAFGCRVRALSPIKHRAPVWVVHLAGLLCCGWIALAALLGVPMHAVDAAVLVMAGAHIWGTYHTWAGGEVPTHAERPGALAWPVLSPSEDGERQR